MIVTLNINSINDKISRALAYSPKTLAASKLKAQARVKTEKAILIQQFEEHPASDDISRGPDAGSTVLGSQHSLFGYLGFESERKPITEMKNFLRRMIQLKDRKPIIKQGRLYASHAYQVQIPDENDIDKAPEAQVDWEKSRKINWVRKVKDGLSNLEHYMWRKGMGRSTGGVQVKGKYNEDSFSGVDRYLLEMLNDLRKRFSK